jgi:lipopolysaccharide transport system ATP-binding protein
MRLAFSVAAHLEPEILLVDEVLAVGDALFQKKCLGKMEDVSREGRTVLLVSHNMGVIRSLCSRAVFLEEGAIAEIGKVTDCIEAYFRAIGALPAAGADDRADSSPQKFGFGHISLPGASNGNSVSPAEAFEVRSTFRPPEDVSGFTMHCILEDMQGRQILHLRWDSASLGRKWSGDGGLEVRVKAPPLWLSSGMYSVYFKANLRSHCGVSQLCSDRFPLDINGNANRYRAMLSPTATWRVDAVCPSS